VSPSGLEQQRPGCMAEYYPFVSDIKVACQ